MSYKLINEVNQIIDRAKELEDKHESELTRADREELSRIGKEIEAFKLNQLGKGVSLWVYILKPVRLVELGIISNQWDGGHECLGVNKWSPKERAAYLLAIADSLNQVTEDYENIIVLDLRRKAA